VRIKAKKKKRKKRKKKKKKKEKYQCSIMTTGLLESSRTFSEASSSSFPSSDAESSLAMAFPLPFTSAIFCFLFDDFFIFRVSGNSIKLTLEFFADERVILAAERVSLDGAAATFATVDCPALRFGAIS
jgi:hypothetical protein